MSIFLSQAFSAQINLLEDTQYQDSIFESNLSYGFFRLVSLPQRLLFPILLFLHKLYGRTFIVAL